MPAQGRVLIIAGSDSGGGAGIQGDIKTVTALGGYAATAITALTAQNTLGVFGIHDVPEAFIAQQIKLVLEDMGADVIKTGMLHKASVIDAVADALAPYPEIPLIVDPVMVAKDGSALLQRDATDILKERLYPRTLLLTPNIPEAELLSGMVIKTPEDMQRAAQWLLTLGPSAILLKGGHLDGPEVTDILVERVEGLDEPKVTTISSPRFNTRHTHGTGCTLASAIATGVAQGFALSDAFTRARAYVAEAIRSAPNLGKGHGPLNHGHTLKKP